MTPAAGPEAPEGRAVSRLRPVLLFLVAVLACHRPGWETTLTVPVMSRRFSIQDLGFVPFIGHVRPGPNEVLQFDIDYSLDTIWADELLGRSAGEGRTEFILPDFVISPVGTAASALPVGQLVGLPVPDSVLTPVPRFAADTLLAATITGVDSLFVASAVVRIRVDNRTDLDFDSVRVELPGVGAPAFAAAVPARSSGVRRSVAAAVLMTSCLPISVRAVCPGSGGQPVWLRARDSVIVTVTVDSLRAEWGRLSLGQHAGAEAVRFDTLYLSGRHRIRIDSAHLASGIVTVALANDLPFGVRCSLALEEVGQTHMLDLGARDSLGWLVSLNDAVYRNINRDSSQLTLACRVSGRLTGEPVELGPDDGLRVAMQAESVGFSYAQGRVLDTIWSSLLSDSLFWSVPESLRGLPVRLSSVRLIGRAFSAFNAVGVFETEFAARAPGGATAVESLRFSLAAGTPEQPMGTGFECEIAPLLNIVPDRLSVSGRVGVFGAVELWDRSWVTSHGSAVVPLRLKLMPFTYSVGPWAVPLDSALRRFTRSYIRGAELEAGMSNHLPLSVRAEILLWSAGQDTARVPISLPAPRLEPSGGWVMAPLDTLVRAGLDSIGVQVVAQEPCSAKLRLYFEETDTVALRSVDYFEVSPALLRLDVDIQER